MNSRDLFEALNGADDWMLEHSEQTAEERTGRRGAFPGKRALVLLAAVVAVFAVTVSVSAIGLPDLVGWITGIFSGHEVAIPREAVEQQVDAGEWISLNGENIAAILPETPVRILLSADGGDTWRESVVDGSDSMYAYGDLHRPDVYYGGWIGFFGEGGGYLVLTSEVSLGNQPMRIYLTDDGGSTWREIGNPYDANAHQCVLTGAGFASEEIGFISYRYFEDNGPDIWWTRDGGKTWQELRITLPDGYNYTPLSPAFDGPDGTYPITYWDEDVGEETTLELYTHDYGLTWSTEP